MLDRLIIQKRLRVPKATNTVAGTPSEASEAVARQMDAVLAQAGFKATRELLEHIAVLEPGAATDHAVLVIGAVRELVGDHVAHNVYFIDFPRNVPDTLDFWLSSLRQAIVGDRAGHRVGDAGGVPSDSELLAFMSTPWFNLLDLPNYGRYQHTYAEMLAAHETLIPSIEDQVTILHLGGTVEDEAGELYRELASSTVPLGDADRPVLELLTATCMNAEQPSSVPVRENRAVINAARLAAGRPLVGIDTVTDVLRLACQVSDGDATLRTSTRFRSFTRGERRILMAALEEVIAANPSKLGDIPIYAGRWKRLGERLHPGEREFARFPHAREVFAVSHGDRSARSLAGRVEMAFGAGLVRVAVGHLAKAPGMLIRSLDRVLRAAQEQDDTGSIDDALSLTETVIDKVSGRVLLSTRQHLNNRGEPASQRIFHNRGRRAWVTEDRRVPLTKDVIQRASTVIGNELTRRLPETGRLLVEAEMLGVALPLSGSVTEAGFGVLPRGSVQRVDHDVVRLFTYWRETSNRTDYDLSALFLNAQFQPITQVSYTNIRWGSVTHSGDITSAPTGASEFIDIPLDWVARQGVRYIVPEINVYAGEGFDEIAESIIGFMSRGHGQRGAPFEAATVRTRSTMRGTGRVALPMAFFCDDDGDWYAKYVHLYLAGHANFNRVEGNHRSTALLAQSIMRRRFLTVADLVDVWAPKTKGVTVLAEGEDIGDLEEPVTYIGMGDPGVPLPDGSTVATLATLNQLIPE